MTRPAMSDAAVVPKMALRMRAHPRMNETKASDRGFSRDFSSSALRRAGQEGHVGREPAMTASPATRLLRAGRYFGRLPAGRHAFFRSYCLQALSKRRVAFARFFGTPFVPRS